MPLVKITSVRDGHSFGVDLTTDEPVYIPHNVTGGAPEHGATLDLKLVENSGHQSIPHRAVHVFLGSEETAMKIADLRTWLMDNPFPHDINDLSEDIGWRPGEVAFVSIVGKFPRAKVYDDPNKNAVAVYIAANVEILHEFMKGDDDGF